MVVYTQREPLGVVIGHLAVEFPGVDPGAQDRARADHRQHRGLQAVVGRAAERLSAGGSPDPPRLPKGVLNFITGSAAEIGAAITESPHVRAISFTGSTAAGKHIHRSRAA